MTREEAKLTLQENFGLLSFEYPGRISEAIKIAIEVLSQPSLPSNLDEAAEKYAWQKEEPLAEGERLSSCFNPRIEAFKAGAEWMAGQGVIKETQVYANRWTDVDEVIVNLGRGEYGFKAGDKVIVQIRRK